MSGVITDPLDDLIILMTLVHCSCEFDNGRKCEVKLKIDPLHEIEGSKHGELYLRMDPHEVAALRIGEVYAVHLHKT